MTSSEIDKGTLDSLVAATDEEFVKELIETFLEDSPNLIAEMRGALDTHEHEAFRRAAHTLKSNAASFGAFKLSKSAKELEMIGKSGDLKSVGDKIDDFEATYGLVEKELRNR